MIDNVFTNSTTPAPWLDPDAPAVPCADGSLYPDAWFPDSDAPVVLTREAQRLCRSECPLRDACLTWALDNHVEEGMWGGVRQKERRQLAKARRAA